MLDVLDVHLPLSSDSSWGKNVPHSENWDIEYSLAIGQPICPTTPSGADWKETLPNQNGSLQDKFVLADLPTIQILLLCVFCCSICAILPWI